MTPTASNFRTAAALLGAASTFIAIPLPAALARQADQPAEATPSPAKAQQDALLAREIIRLAMLDIRAIPQPAQDDYQATHVLLGFAHDLDPQNPEIVRRQIEAAFNAGAQDAVLEHTRALILLDREDTVAQLRLITSTISKRYQNADDRLAEYERYLSGDAKGVFDASIRSRLALDAALLLRERGDEKGFRERLVLSMKLDRTHKEAAALGATVYSASSPDDAAGSVDMLVNLLNADPIDPNIHLSLARTLTANGAFTSARRFHNNALTIASALGAVNDDLMSQSRVLKWYTDGAEATVKALDEAVAAERDAVTRDFKRLADAGKPTTSARKPEDVHLPASLMALSIMASESVGDMVAATDRLKQFTDLIQKSIDQIKNPRTRGEMTEEQATRTTLEAMIQLNTVRLWANLDTAKTNENPEAFKGVRELYPTAATILDGLWALRAGKPEETIELCKDIPGDRLARVALGLAYEQIGNKDQAIATYRRLMTEEPLQMAAAWARSRAIKLGYADDSKLSAALEKLVADPKVPSWIDDVVTKPNEFLRVSAEVSGTGGTALEYLPVKLTVINQSPIPLALGPDRALNSRFVMLPKLERIGVDSLVRPEVIDLDRRLRLMPQERLEVEVWPDPGQSGWLISTLANRSVPVRWRFVQGFLYDPSNGFKPGPMCVTAETEAFVIRPLPDSTLSADELAKAIAGSPEGSLGRYAGLTRAMILSPLVLEPFAKPKVQARRGATTPEKSAAPEAVSMKPVADALVARYQSLSPAMRATVALMVPHAKLCPDMATVDAVTRGDQDPLVRCIVLCTRVTDPADELLKAAAASGDARVQAVGASVAARLASTAKLYCRMSPDDLRPPKPAGAN